MLLRIQLQACSFCFCLWPLYLGSLRKHNTPVGTFGETRKCRTTSSSLKPSKRKDTCKDFSRWPFKHLTREGARLIPPRSSKGVPAIASVIRDCLCYKLRGPSIHSKGRALKSGCSAHSRADQVSQSSTETFSRTGEEE